ncbi:MAG TPA: ATP-dependent DNA helicase [Bacillota bacterium]|nr:ATP-dependent DNA helicase [Fastidiosipila sp.]HPX92972.1 ATP-dependent DNA helicase [Bacillota bacterium]HQB80786.1 ATP-dependent DNA helicase [Bacillota bacterium]
MDPNKQNKPVLSVAVRDLAESARRYGGLSGPLYAGVTGLEGTRAHQDFFERADHYFPGREILTELPLSGCYRAEGLPFDLQLQGRCDLVALGPGDSVTLAELKSFRGNAASIPREGDPAHLAQALLYAHLLLSGDFFSEKGLAPAEIEVELRYISIDDGSFFTIRRPWTREELGEQYLAICADYTELARPLYLHRRMRDEANRKASFPYGQLREGQRSMMQEVIAAVRDRTVLFVQAPTGIGKTMAALYPAIKAQANGLTDYLFYLTPTRSQRGVAEDSLDDLERAGSYIRSLTVRAKEQMCLSPGHFCDMKVCPFAVRYHDHLRDALKKSYGIRRLTPEDVLSLAREFSLCPFELSLSLLPTVDVVICDYNYLFNPRVRLHGWLDEPGQAYTLLVDEAHNLARRSREMFSAVISRSQVTAIKNVMAGHVTEPGEQGRLNRQVCGSLDRLVEQMDRFRPLLTAKELPPENELVQEAATYQPVLRQQFLATRVTPPRLLEQVSSASSLLTRYLTDYPDFPGRRSMMVPYFDLIFFLRVAERYYNDSYITTWRPAGEADLDLTLLALDASSHLTDIYRNQSPVVFFSATLSPLPYYLTLLDARSATDKPEVIRLPSPFPKERRLTICFEAYSIRYTDRARTLPEVAKLVCEAALLRKGHYLVFSPSFAYQSQLVRALSHIENKGIDFLVQPSGMTEGQKEKYLAYFRGQERENSLVGLTVLGSLFNEGIDLVGEELTGVMVIGTGIPGLSPERDLLSQYYDAKSGNGFEYAYMWPGFNRVTQAAGRLIRSEDDFGIVLLIDDRYGRPDYLQLIPDDWNARHVEDRDQCLEMIRDFWQNFD